jgi:hypothetical protein
MTLSLTQISLGAHFTPWGVNMWHIVVEPLCAIKAIGIQLDVYMWQMTINQMFTRAILRLYSKF